MVNGKYTECLGHDKYQCASLFKVFIDSSLATRIGVIDRDVKNRFPRKEKEL